VSVPPNLEDAYLYHLDAGRSAPRDQAA